MFDLLNAGGIDIPVELRPTVGVAWGLLRYIEVYRKDPTVVVARLLADAWDGYRKVFACSGHADTAWQAYRERTELLVTGEDDKLKQQLCDSAAMEFAELLSGDLYAAEQVPIQRMGRP
jgi:hypothetical protein